MNKEQESKPEMETDHGARPESLQRRLPDGQGLLSADVFNGREVGCGQRGERKPALS